MCIAGKFVRTNKMKIKVESERIIKAVKKLDGSEIVLENLDDAREAINLILLRTGLFQNIRMPNRRKSGYLHTRNMRLPLRNSFSNL